MKYLKYKADQRKINHKKKWRKKIKPEEKVSKKRGRPKKESNIIIVEEVVGDDYSWSQIHFFMFLRGNYKFIIQVMEKMDAKWRRKMQSRAMAQSTPMYHASDEEQRSNEEEDKDWRTSPCQHVREQ